MFPILSSTDKELVSLKLEGEEHLEFTNDLIYTHKLKRYKTSASFLLIKFSETYLGLNHFIVNYCYEIIDYLIKNDSLNNGSKPEFNYKYLDESSVQNVLGLINQEKTVEVALLVISMLSQNILRDKNCFINLRNLIVEHGKLLMNSGNIGIQDKMSLVFGIFTAELFKFDSENETEILNNKNAVSTILHYLLIQLLKHKQNQGLACQAGNSLSKLTHNDTNCSLIEPVILELMSSIIEQIKEVEIIIYFNILLDIISYIKIDDYLELLVSSLIQRILIEAKSPHNAREHGYSIYLEKCFHCLEQILGKTNLFFQNTHINISQGNYYI